jgi:hypothetical protein
LRHSGKFLASVYDFGSDSIAIFYRKER